MRLLTMLDVVARQTTARLRRKMESISVPEGPPWWPRHAVRMTLHAMIEAALQVRAEQAFRSN